MTEWGQQLITIEQAAKRRQHLLIGYPEFREWDRQHRQPILAQAKAMVEAWFERGVEYSKEPIPIIPIPVYANPPRELQTALELAAGEIKRNILERLVSIFQWPDVIFRWGARPQDKAGCGPDAFMHFLPLGTVFETEHLPPSERAEVVCDRWYDLELYWQYYHINKFRITESWQWGPDPFKRGFERATEGNDEVEQKLKQSGLDWVDLFIFCSIYQRKGFFDEEVAEGLSQLGKRNMTGNAVRMRHERMKDTLIELGLLKKRFTS